MLVIILRHLFVSGSCLGIRKPVASATIETQLPKRAPGCLGVTAANHRAPLSIHNFKGPPAALDICQIPSELVVQGSGSSNMSSPQQRTFP